MPSFDGAQPSIKSSSTNCDLSVSTGGNMTISTSPSTDRSILDARLRMAKRSLVILETQAAGYSALTIPAHLQIELDEKRAEVAALEGQLAGSVQQSVSTGANVAPVASRTQLRENLERAFSLEELRTLCSDLGVDFDLLPSSDKGAMAREMITYLERRSRIPELIALCWARRPNVAWE
jgi:hypothetical protein